ncbi:hypothetical protein MKX03_022029, partial [Papaver bracteatum]
LKVLVNSLVSIILGCILLVVFEVLNTGGVLSILSVVVMLSFVFGDTSKRVLENTIFVFSYHPFDVGDIVQIDNNK